MDYGLQFLLLVGISVMGCIKVTLQGRMSRQYVHQTQDSVWFNALLFAAIAICLSLIFPLATPDLPAILYAIAAGACVVIFQTSYALALVSGPVSLTSLIVNFSILLSAAFGMVMFGDRLYLSQLIGIIALVASMFLSVDKNEKQKKAQRRWLLLALCAMAADSGISFAQRLYNALPIARQPNMDISFSVVMYIAASALAFGFYFFSASRGARAKSSIGFNRNVLGYVAAIAVVLSIYQKGLMLSIANIEGTFLYPTHAGLMSLIMTFIGVLFFRDRLTPRQKLGVAFGILCVILMNIRIGPAF